MNSLDLYPNINNNIRVPISIISNNMVTFYRNETNTINYLVTTDIWSIWSVTLRVMSPLLVTNHTGYVTGRSFKKLQRPTIFALENDRLSRYGFCFSSNHNWNVVHNNTFIYLFLRLSCVPAIHPLMTKLQWSHEAPVRVSD